MNSLIKKCVCGNNAFEHVGERNGALIKECKACGVRHQDLLMTEEELDEYYGTDYHAKHYRHGLLHDCEVAQKRLDNEYGDKFQTPALDVGSGNGAFVAVAQHRHGSEVYGVEVADNVMNENMTQQQIKEESIYKGRMQDIHFPTDEFATIVCNDVMEHLVDPMALLKEMFRCLQQNGVLFVGIPDFFSPHGKHHWKQIEHLWFFTVDDFVSLLEEVGFEILNVYNPIPGKVSFTCVKPVQSRVKILVPPGIGDSYWSFVKMQAFLKHNNIALPDVYVSDPDKKQRSLPFARMLPFINGAGYVKHNTKLPEFQEAYMQDKRSVFHNVVGNNYFIAFNGVMRYGKSLEEVHPEYETNWELPMFVSKAQQRFTEDFIVEHGEYIVVYFVPHGMYKQWLREFSAGKIIETLKGLQKATGKKLVLIGATWDRGTDLHRAMCSKLEIIDMTGQTSMDEFFGLARAADGIVGFPCGTTIVPTMLGTPTVLLWNNYFNDNFWKYSCPPNSPYRYLDTANLKPEEVVQTCLDTFYLEL